MKSQFSGQQDGERVLYAVDEHEFYWTVQYIKVIFTALALLVIMWTISPAMPSVQGLLIILGLISSVAVVFIGSFVISMSKQKNIGYITDRRVIRFTATTPWTVNSRSITWDEVVKIKTKTAGFLWRGLGIGSVIAHARSTVAPLDNSAEQPINNDDVELSMVGYYQDLGNYLDKLLYLYKREPAELKNLRPFVAKPKGKRY